MLLSAPGNPNAVLVVEGEAGARQTLTDYLSAHLDDLMVWSAATGREAIQLLEDRPVDVVVVNEHLPDGGGVDFLDDAGGLLRGVPRLVLCSAAHPDSCDQPPARWLRRPEPKAVLEALERFLPGRAHRTT